MDASRFDDLARALSAHPSRRRLVYGLAASVLAQAAAAGRGMGSGSARKRNKRKKKKIKTNPFGCVDFGGKCYGGDARCCSGICSGGGKRGRCVAHNQGACDRDDSSCPVPVPCGVDGECYRTTGKAGFCGAAGTCDCHPCKRDRDCQDNPEYGPGSACIVCVSDTENSCVGVNGSQGTACVPPAALA